jgi:hypothetical protein
MYVTSLSNVTKKTISAAGPFKLRRQRRQSGGPERRYYVVQGETPDALRVKMRSSNEQVRDYFTESRLFLNRELLKIQSLGFPHI